MTTTAWIVALLFLVLGASAAGAVAWFWVRRTYGDQESATQLRNELDAYRGEVHDHFVETARRVDALTHAYKDVYDHLERGAYRLVGEAELRERLEDAKSEPVTIEGIGQRRSIGSGARGGAAASSHDDPRAEGRGGTASHDAGRSRGAEASRDEAEHRRASHDAFADDAGSPSTADDDVPEDAARKRSALRDRANPHGAESREATSDGDEQAPRHAGDETDRPDAASTDAEDSSRRG